LSDTDPWRFNGLDSSGVFGYILLTFFNSPYFLSGVIMKTYVVVFSLLLSMIFFATTGFQCGSAETTSAKLYMQQKQWDKAEASLLKEVTKNDKNEEAWFLLGQVRLEMKKYTEMNDAYTKTLALSDVHKADIQRNRLAIWAMMYNDGVSSYNKGRDDAANYDKAIKEFETAIAMNPDSAGTYYVLALAHYAKQNNSAALQSLASALEKKPDFGDAARLAGSILYSQAAVAQEAKDSVGMMQCYNKASQFFEKAYKADPTNADNITNMIDAYERTGQSDKAMSLTKNAIERDPNNKVYRYAYGVFLLKQDNFEEAAKQFKKAIEIDPGYADAEHNLGVSYLNWGVVLKAEAEKKAEAEAKAKKSKEVKVDESYKDKLREALPYLENSAKRHEDDANLWQRLTQVYTILGQKDKAEMALAKFKKLSGVK
jgi:tetratricopeptide (TPR) repeat protein